MPFARNIKPTSQNQPFLSPFGRHLIANAISAMHYILNSGALIVNYLGIFI